MDQNAVDALLEVSWCRKRRAQRFEKAEHVGEVGWAKDRVGIVTDDKVQADGDDPDDTA